MKLAEQTKVRVGEDITWAPLPGHVHLFHKEIVNAADADAMGIGVSSILLEQIGVGGAVLPHYHDVAEVIHITVGKVKLLCNGKWKSYKAGDTFLVPKGTVHSVVNDDTVSTYQVSIFIPTNKKVQKNRFFKTFHVQDHYSFENEGK